MTQPEHIVRLRGFAYLRERGQGYASDEMQDALALLRDYDALAARLAEALRDAKRYRWLKEHCVKYYDPPGFLLEWARDSRDVDASIDAEIAADSARACNCNKPFGAHMFDCPAAIGESAGGGLGIEPASAAYDWTQEDPGSCPTCGKKWQMVRPGKSQPNCECP
jgi:hypothetical protein